MSKHSGKGVRVKNCNKRMAEDDAAGEAAAAHPSGDTTVGALNAPVAARFMAYAIDWAVGGIVSGIPAVLAYSALTRRTDMFSNLYVFEALGFPWAVGMVVGLLCVVAALFYYVWVPWKVWPGQTLGKRLMHVRIADKGLSAGEASVGQLLVRQAVVGFLMEGSAFVVCRYIREMAVLLTRVDVNYYWEIAGIVITAVSAVMAFLLPARRALHDYLSGTRVVPSDDSPVLKAQ